jgi:hypothetical protein
MGKLAQISEKKKIFKKFFEWSQKYNIHLIQVQDTLKFADAKMYSTSLKFNRASFKFTFYPFYISVKNMQI